MSVLDTGTFADSGSGLSTIDIPVTLPGGAPNEGDRLYAVAHGRAPNSTWNMNAPSGWSIEATLISSSNTRSFLYSKTAGASEPSTYTWTFVKTSGTSSPSVLGAVWRCGPDAVLDVVGTVETATDNAGTHTAPSITTTVDEAVLFGVYFHSSTSWNPSAREEAADPVLWVPSSGNMLEVTAEQLTSAGATGARTLNTVTGNSVNRRSMLFSVAGTLEPRPRIKHRGSVIHSDGGNTAESVNLNPSHTLAAGSFAIATAVSRNTVGTTSGESTEHTVSDSVGNVWTRVKEYRRTSGVIDDGVVHSMWSCRVENEITTSDTITLTIGAADNHLLLTVKELIPAEDGFTFNVAGAEVANGSGGPYSVTLSGLEERNYALVGAVGNNGTNFGSPDPDYERWYSTSTSTVKGFVAKRVLMPGTGDTFTGTTADSDWVAILAAFEEVATGGNVQLPTVTNETRRLPTDVGTIVGRITPQTAVIEDDAYVFDFRDDADNRLSLSYNNGTWTFTRKAAGAGTDLTLLEIIGEDTPLFFAARYDEENLYLQIRQGEDIENATVANDDIPTLTVENLHVGSVGGVDGFDAQNDWIAVYDGPLTDNDLAFLAELTRHPNPGERSDPPPQGESYQRRPTIESGFVIRTDSIWRPGRDATLILREEPEE